MLSSTTSRCFPLPDDQRAMDDLQVRLKFKKNDADDWTKVEDKALRKKLQNRLAKRKSRSNAPKSTKNTKEREQTKPEPREISQETSETTSPESQQDAASPVEPVSDAQALLRISQSLSESRQRLDSVDLQVVAFFSTPGLSEHRFLCLTQYSLIRGLVQNANILAIEPSSLVNDDALSPWTLANPYPTVAPHDLTPTPVQLCTPHHPYLDIMAPRGLRDNILLTLMDDNLEEQLCYELHLNSFTIWGSQPWNEMAWEVTQTFATNWAWLLDEQTIRSSNFWRGERGESPLVLPDLGRPALNDISGGILGEFV